MRTVNELKKVLGFPLSKEKTYVDSPADAPKGADVKQGPKGGYFYESDAVESTSKPSAERVMFKPTEKQEAKWNAYKGLPLPTDEVFKDIWKKKHGGKEKGWGIGKRDWVITQLGATKEYQMGMWQGRVDAANKTEYTEERGDKTFNYGYYKGFNEYDSYRRGIDKKTAAEFDGKYVMS